MPIRKIENFHILLWLLKDLSWMMTWRAFGIFMIFPTMGFALYITWRRRYNKSELFYNLAIICWICANSLWMVAEFFGFEEHFKIYSLVLFVLGIVIICSYHFLRFGDNDSKFL